MDPRLFRLVFDDDAASSPSSKPSLARSKPRRRDRAEEAVTAAESSINGDEDTGESLTALEINMSKFYMSHTISRAHDRDIFRDARAPSSRHRQDGTTGSARSTAGVSKPRRHQSALPPIKVDDSDDLAALKRARNTLAARESCRKKLEREQKLQRQLQLLEAQNSKLTVQITSYAAKNTALMSENNELKAENVALHRDRTGARMPSRRRRGSIETIIPPQRTRKQTSTSKDG